MKRPVPYAEARRILLNVPVPVSFWLCTNQNLRSLTVLASALDKVDDDIFRYHVNRDRNDFEAWIRDIVKDKDLAREIARVKTKETLIRKILERVAALQKIVALSKPRKPKSRAARKKVRKKPKKRQKSKKKRAKPVKKRVRKKPKARRR
jgi:hypothetical protein